MVFIYCDINGMVALYMKKKTLRGVPLYRDLLYMKYLSSVSKLNLTSV